MYKLEKQYKIKQKYLQGQCDDVKRVVRITQ